MISMIFIIGLSFICFITYIISVIIKLFIKPFIVIFFGNKIKKNLKKDDQYYKEKYKKTRKYIDSLDKGFRKTMTYAWEGVDCSEEEYITTQKQNEEKAYHSTLNKYSFNLSFGLSFLCIWVLVVLIISTGNKNNIAEPETPKNPVAEKKADFQKTCEGLKQDTLESDFLKLDRLKEQANMIKKRAKILYKQGLILHSQYQQAKDRRSAINQKWGQYWSCLNAKENYKRAIATISTEASQEETKNNTKQLKKDASPVFINSPPPQKRYTNSEITEACSHCINYYNCMIKTYEKYLNSGIFPKSKICNGEHECWQLRIFLKDNKFISKKHREKLLSNNPWHIFPNYYKPYCSETEKVSCRTSTCWSNNPDGTYDLPTSQCDSRNQIEVFKFLKDSYCGKFQKQFFKL